MNSTPQNSNGHGRGSLLSRWWWMPVLAIVIVVGVALAVSPPSQLSSAAQSVAGPLYPVKSGPLTISVTSSGSIRNSDSVVLKNEVEGVATILYIIEEGASVKKGDLLVELDSSQLQDKKVDQEIKVETDYAALIKAKETLEITKKQGEADIQSAEVGLELALLDLEKYTGLNYAQVLDMEGAAGEKADLEAIADKLAEVDWTTIDLSQAKEGEYRQERQQAENKITLADAELKRAKDKLAGSQKLHDKGYITKTELEADELEHKRRTLELEVAESELKLLEKFTKRRSLAERMNEVGQKAFELKKARHAATSNMVDAQAQLTSRDMSHKREKEKLQKLADQITKCKVYAPSEGMVVYGTSGESSYSRSEPLSAGIQVRERQDLIRIPVAGNMVADIKIHESVVEKIREGLPAIITTDAMPGREFRGHVRKVAVVPDAQDRWLNPGLKVYNTEVVIEGEAADELKPGMSCTTEIIVDRYTDTAYVPVQAVLRVDGEPTVYVSDSNGKTQPRKVSIGLDNTRMIRIIEGLSEGERVMLNPPVAPSTKPHERPSLADIEIPPAKPAAARPASGGAEAAVVHADEKPAADRQEKPAEPAGGVDITALRARMEKMTDEEKKEFMQSEEGQKIMQQIRAQFGNRGGGGGAPRGERQADK